MRLHAGMGTSRGALTVFPVWMERQGGLAYTADLAKVSLSERSQGPAVGALVATNVGARPRLMFEGMLLEGGWQNRMLLRSVLVPGQQELELPVACVEEGRWGGATSHTVRHRRASVRLRGAGRPSVSRRGDLQSQVWQRVREYDARFGADETTSFVGHAERAEDRARRLVRGIRPLDGQSGVVVAISGQPVMLEVFESPTVLRPQLRSILLAAAMDALGRPADVTPSRRARRFVERVGAIRRTDVASAGSGIHAAGATEYAEVTALDWQGQPVHLTAVNPRHELMAA